MGKAIMVEHRLSRKNRAEIDLLEAEELMHKLGYSLPDVNGLYWNREK
jgi:hypothetical protein